MAATDLYSRFIYEISKEINVIRQWVVDEFHIINGMIGNNDINIV